MSTPNPGYVRPPTDPLREFNEYFSKLYNQYGGQQGMLDRGFTPDKLREMQAPLRELQLNMSATDDQRRDALVNALNTLHKQGMSINNSSNRSVPVGTPMPAPASMGMPAQPMPAQGGLTVAEQPEIVVTPQRPMPQTPEIVRPIPTDNVFNPGPSRPAPSFDRNAALREINTYAGEMNKQFQGGIFSSGVDPMQLAKYRGDLVKLTTDMNSTPEQHQQALQAAKDYLYQFKPVERRPIDVTPPMAVTPPPMQQPQGLSLSNVPMQPQSIANAMQQPQGLSLSNVPRTLSLSNVPQQPAPQPAPTGMAMGGLMAKYYGGAC